MNNTRFVLAIAIVLIVATSAALISPRIGIFVNGNLVGDRANIDLQEGTGIDQTGGGSDSTVTVTTAILPAYQLPQSCADGQIGEWNDTTKVWDCGTDNTGAGGSAIVLDLADDDVDESTDLTEIAITGDTNSIFTESAADKLLIAVANNWPTSDAADALSANPSDCAANTFADAIAANGDLTCNSVTTADVTDDSLLEADLDAVDTPSDEECLTFESGAGGDFEWQSCGGGAGDSIEVEDGDDAGTFTTIDTTARFEDQGDINFTFADGGAGGPDTITATVRANSVALATDTTGNFVGSVTNGTGITGGDGGSENAALTLAFAYTATLGGNPALSASECIFASTGLICEGSTANTNETLLTFADPSADRTLTFPNVTDTIAVSGDIHGDGGNCTAGNYPLGVDAAGAVQSCTADDDVPESGDFGAASDLDSAGDVVADAIGTAELNDAADTPAAGECVIVASDTSQVEYGACSAGAGDITDVGPGYSDGAAFTDGKASTGSILFVWEGTAVDTNELTIGGPSNPAVDQLFQYPDDQLADDDLIVANGAGTFQYKGLPDCNATTDDDLQYDQATNAFTCDSTADDDSPEAGDYAAASIDGDDVNSNIAGRSLTLTAGSPDTLDVDVELYTDTKGIWFEDPTAADDFQSIWTANGFAATITKIWCESDQTVNMDLQVDDGTPANVNGTDLVCDSTPAEDETLSGDVTMADGDRLDLVITSVSGTPTFVSIFWTFTYDD